MGRKSLLMVGTLVLAIGVCSAFGQEVSTTKKVVVNPDGSYSVIEYPVGKDVTVNLLPAGTVAGKGVIHVTRSADGTHMVFNMSGVPGDVKSYYAYAVDPGGATTLLGPIMFDNGTATADFTTPLNQFMVVLSPTEGLTTLDPTTSVIYRSEVPSGYVVVPRRVAGDTKARAVATAGASPYDVPVLNVPSFGEKTRDLKIKFSGDLSGLEGKASLTRKKGAATKVTMHFDDMNKVPKGKVFTLWASSPDGQYTKLGQVINSGKKDEAEIRSETTLDDFGLFMTVDDAEVTVPTGRTYSTFTVLP